jgi:hypothetical protein
VIVGIGGSPDGPVVTVGLTVSDIGAASQQAIQLDLPTLLAEAGAPVQAPTVLLFVRETEAQVRAELDAALRKLGLR